MGDWLNLCMVAVPVGAVAVWWCEVVVGVVRRGRGGRVRRVRRAAPAAQQRSLPASTQQF